MKIDLEMRALRKYNGNGNENEEEEVEEVEEENNTTKNKANSKKNKKAAAVDTATTSNSSEAHSLSSAISLISRLVVTGGDVFSNQFIEAKGCSASLSEFALSQSSFASSLLNIKQNLLKWSLRTKQQPLLIGL